MTKVDPPILNEPSFDGFCKFLDSFDKYVMKGGKRALYQQISPEICALLREAEGFDVSEIEVSRIASKKHVKEIKSTSMKYALSRLLRPSRPEAVLDLMRRPAVQFTPVCVAQHNIAFRRLVQLLAPDATDETLRDIYVHPFRMGKDNLLARRLLETINGDSIDTAMTKVLRLARDADESAKFLEPLGLLKQSRPASVTPVTPSTREGSDGPNRNGSNRNHNHQRRNRPSRSVRGSSGPPIHKKERAPERKIICYNCGKQGHFANECRGEKAVCDKCKRGGHKTEFCGVGKRRGCSCFSSSAASTSAPAHSNPSRQAGTHLPVVCGMVGSQRAPNVLFDCGSDICLVSPTMAKHAIRSSPLPQIKKIATLQGVAEVRVVHEVAITLDPSAFTPRGVEVVVRAYEIDMPYDALLSYGVMVETGVLPRLEAFVSPELPDILPEEEPIREKATLPGASLSEKSVRLQQRLLEVFSDVWEPHEGHSELEPYDLVLTSDRVVNARASYVPAPKLPLLRGHVNELIQKGFVEPSRSEYSSPTLIVPKGTDKTRMVIDFRGINELTEPFDYPIPKVNECLATLAGCKYFATLDMSSGYHQVRLTERSRQYTAFNTPLGRLQYTGMPFGLRNAGAHFQMAMERGFSNLLMQACVIYVDDIIVFGRTEGEYLRNLKRVLDRSRELRIVLNREKSAFGATEVDFLGWRVSGTGYRVSPERIADVEGLKPPSSRKGAQSLVGFLNWLREFVPNFSSTAKPLLELAAGKSDPGLPEQAVALQSLKDTICKAPVLAHFDVEKEHVVMTDASDVGYGAVLLQNGRPVGFMSHAFSDVQRRWATGEQEAFAIVKALQQWRPLLVWSRFTVKTDHRNLLYMAKSTNAKVRRWYESISDLNFTISHVAGVDNGAADGLSRVFTATAQASDEDIRRAHESGMAHLSVRATVELLGRNGTPVNRRRVASIVTKCPICQILNDGPTQPDPGLHTAVTRPFQRVAMDTMGPFQAVGQFKYVLVIVDMCSRWTELVPLKSTQAAEAAKAFVNHWLLRFGTPRVLQTDGGTQFRNAIMKDLAERAGFSTHVTTAYHPQSNGIVERANGPILRILKARKYAMKSDDWVDHLNVAQFIVNSTPRLPTHLSPAEIIYGTDFVVPATLTVTDALPGDTAHADFLEAAALCRTLAERRVKTMRAEALAAAKETRDSALQAEYILLKYPARPPSKLLAGWRGPMGLVGPVEHEGVITGYQVQDLNSKVVSTVAPSRVRAFDHTGLSADDMLNLSAAADAEWLVEAVLDSRQPVGGTSTNKKDLEFLVRWAGYEPDDDSWEPFENLDGCVALSKFLEGK